MMTLERYGAEMKSLGEYVATVKQIRKWLKKNGNDGVPSAVEWYRKAAEQGNEVALDAVKRLGG